MIGIFFASLFFCASINAIAADTGACPTTNWLNLRDEISEFNTKVHENIVGGFIWKNVLGGIVKEEATFTVPYRLLGNDLDLTIDLKELEVNDLTVVNVSEVIPNSEKNLEVDIYYPEGNFLEISSKVGIIVRQTSDMCKKRIGSWCLIKVCLTEPFFPGDVCDPKRFDFNFQLKIKEIAIKMMVDLVIALCNDGLTVDEAVNKIILAVLQGVTSGNFDELTDPIREVMISGVEVDFHQIEHLNIHVEDAHFLKKKLISGVTSFAKNSLNKEGGFIRNKMMSLLGNSLKNQLNTLIAGVLKIEN